MGGKRQLDQAHQGCFDEAHHPQASMHLGRAHSSGNLLSNQANAGAIL